MMSIDDNDFDNFSELKHMPESIVRHFVQNGRCRECNMEVRVHRAFPDSLAVPLDKLAVGEDEEEWIVCWTETSVEEAVEKKHFCVRAEDHPNRISRDEFEELYSK